MIANFDDHADVLAEMVCAAGRVTFGEMNEFLQARGVDVHRGEEELLGEHVRLPHVDPDTTLLGPASEQYVAIVERLFATYPVTLMIGDVASFRSGQEPWWIAWTAPYPPAGSATPGKRPAVNPDLHAVADSVKHCFYEVTEELALLQYRCAELAGTGQLAPEISMEMQSGLFAACEALLHGTLSAVNDDRNADITWAENTYSDGRAIKNKTHSDALAGMDAGWPYNRYLLGDGAPDEFPLKVEARIADPRHVTSQPDEPRRVWKAEEWRRLRAL